jgi:hypothetical protein
MRSSTIWTSAADTNNKVFYYHTQHNRRVRKVDLTKIDFDSFHEIQHAPRRDEGSGYRGCDAISLTRDDSEMKADFATDRAGASIVQLKIVMKNASHMTLSMET